MPPSHSHIILSSTMSPISEHSNPSLEITHSSLKHSSRHMGKKITTKSLIGKSLNKIFYSLLVNQLLGLDSYHLLGRENQISNKTSRLKNTQSRNSKLTVSDLSIPMSLSLLLSTTIDKFKDVQFYCCSLRGATRATKATRTIHSHKSCYVN